MDEKKAPSLFDRVRSVASAVTEVPLIDRLHAGLEAALDPSGSNKIRDGVVAEAKNTAELLATATKKPEKIVEQAQAQVAIVEKASADLKAMAASTDTPNPAEIKKIVSTAEAAGKALDAQVAALKSAQEAFDKSNQDLPKAEAEPDPKKAEDLTKLTDIVTKGDEAMAAIAPAREVLYKMWLEDCQAVADVIAGKKKPEDIRKPVVHTLMGALDAYMKDPEKRFTVTKTDKPELDKVIADTRLPTIIGGNPPKAIGIDPKKFNEAAYNEARAKKAVIHRDAAPVTLRPEQAAKVAQKEKLDKAVAAVATEKTKLGEAQGKIDTSRKALEAKVNEAATAEFDKVQGMITQLGIDAQKTAPGEMLSADDKRTRQAEVSASWEEAMRKFQDVDPERAQEVTKSLADLTKLLFPEQVDKSGKKPAYSRLNFRSMYDNLAKNIGKSKVGKFVGGAINRARSSLDTIVQRLNGEEVEKVKTEKDAQAWVDGIKVKAKSIEERIEAAYSSVPKDLRETLETSLDSAREGIYSKNDQERLSELITICDVAATKLDAYYGNHDELESQLAKAENFIDKATEMALVLNIARVEQMIIDLTQKADNTEGGSELSPEARRQGIRAVNEAWEDVTAQFDDIDQKKKKDIEARIAALGQKLIPPPEASKEAGIRILGHTPLEWSTLVPVWFARKRAEAKAAIGGVFHRQAKENKPAGEADAEVDPQDEEEARQRLEKLRSEEQSCINGRVNYAYRTVHEDMIDDLNTQLKEAGDYVETDRDQFFALMDLCTNAQDVVAAYIKNRAELKALLAKAQAYADKAEEIARELNGAAANTAGKSGEAGGAGVAREPTTALEVLERLKPIQERCSRLSGGLDRARKSVEDKRNLPQYDKEIAAYEASIGGAPSLTELLRLLNAIEKNEHIVAMYGRRHGEVETRLAAIEKHILEAQDIARRLNTEQSPPGGATGDPAPGSSREVPGNKSEVLTSEVAIRAWIESAKSKYESYLNRARVTLEGMTKEMSEKEEHDFKRTPEVLKYSDAVEELERLLNEVINGFNSSQRSEFLSSERFSELRTKVDKLDDECNRRLTAIESAWKNFLDNKKKTRK